MERMTGIDPMFIYSDTPETPMEIAYACIFDPATAEGGYSFERVTDLLTSRIPTCVPSGAGSCPSRSVSITRVGWTTRTSTSTTTSTAPPSRPPAARPSSPPWSPR